jgi:metallophosphoesterase superfamily enzyme
MIFIYASSGEKKALLISDVHLGKVAHFKKARN